ncbi:MAG: hypothetical protein LBV28_00255, partial [Puniceicoccales bacterium]|nr:hypothetical protein [Puniceicoccales bacterium]
MARHVATRRHRFNLKSATAAFPFPVDHRCRRRTFAPVIKISVPALFRKTCFRRTAVTVAVVGAIVILYALTYHKPRNEWDDWFVSIEKNPKLAT